MSSVCSMTLDTTCLGLFYSFDHPDSPIHSINCQGNTLSLCCKFPCEGHSFVKDPWPFSTSSLLPRKREVAYLSGDFGTGPSLRSRAHSCLSGEKASACGQHVTRQALSQESLAAAVKDRGGGRQTGRTASGSSA